MKSVQILLLSAAVFGISAFACKGKETDAAPAKPISTKSEAAPEKANPAPEQKDTLPPPAPAMEFKGPGEKLVKEINGFTITGAPRYFGPDNLYDLIDGGAEVYTAFGLKEMVTADYTSKDKPGVTVTVEIYDMATPKNAKGRFDKFLEGRKDAASAGKGLQGDLPSRGLMGGANVSFWKDKYLVNLTLLDESEKATMETMTALGLELLPLFAKSVDDAV